MPLVNAVPWIGYNRSNVAINPADYDDVREMPRYSVREAAYYLNINAPTLHRWVKAHSRKVASGTKIIDPIIHPAGTDSSEPTLSFINMAEAYVLSSLRLGHRVSLKKIRNATEWLKGAYPTPHPLLSHEFFTDGVGVFVKKLLGRKLSIIEASAYGQVGIPDVIGPFLDRIERDASGTVFKIFPSIPTADSKKVISMVPSVAAGRPIVDRTGVRASVIWNRHHAGESVRDLADDYEISESEVQAAISYIDSIEKFAA